MRDSEQQPTDTGGIESKITSAVDRRSFVKGIGSIGLGSALVGTTRAKGRGNSNSASEELPIGSQLFTYVGDIDSVANYVRHHADAGYDIFEPFYIDDADAIIEAMDETGVTMPSAHTGLVHPDQDDYQDTLDLHLRLGTDWLIAPGGGDWDSKEGILDWVDTLNEAGEAVYDDTDGEIKGVGYHNHSHELEVEYDGMTGYDIFANNINDRVHLQVDTGWTFAGGEDPVAFLNRHKDKIGSLHVKDFVKHGEGDYEMVDILNGDVPIKGCLNVARGSTSCEFLYYEYDNAPNPIDSLYRGADILEKYNGPDRG